MRNKAAFERLFGFDRKLATIPATLGPETTMQKTMITCPTCGKPALYSKDNPDRPFCCHRCKLIDLGEWANEEKRIAGKPYLHMQDDKFDIEE